MNPGEIVVPAGGSTFVTAVMSLHVDVVEFVTSPLPPEILAFFNVPVIMRSFVFAEASALGRSANANAHATVALGGIMVVNAAHAQDVGESAGEISQQVNDVAFHMTPGGEPALITLSASAGTVAVAVQTVFGPSLSAGARARAIADPVFSFDQAAFDEFAERQGFATFDLTDYFRFEFSPLGVEDPPLSSVPQPWTLVLTSLGAGGLALLQGFGQRARRPDRQAS
jgi:hypothetical protein